ncbi:MAG: hypothetical protein HUU10_09590 [Bacteroidetes bacterium]|nr:hypothetical protein [Bacteroidota bacterium]
MKTEQDDHLPILLIHNGPLTDFIRLNDLFRLLRDRWPSRPLYLVAHPDAESLLADCPHFSYFYGIRNPLDEWKLMWGLRKLRFSLLLDLTHRPVTALHLLQRLRVVQQWPARPGEKLTLPQRLERYTSLLSVQPSALWPAVWTTRRHQEQVKKHLMQVNPDKGPLLAIGLSPADPAEKLSDDQWFRLLYLLKKQFPSIRFLFLCQPSDLNRAKTLSTPFGFGTVILPAHHTLQHWYEYLRSSDLLISQDPDVLMLAQAAGHPSFSITNRFPAPAQNTRSFPLTQGLLPGQAVSQLTGDHLASRVTGLLSRT